MPMAKRRVPLSQHSGGLRRQDAERHLQIGDGFFEFGVLFNTLPQTTEDAVGLCHMFGSSLFLVCILGWFGVFCHRLLAHYLNRTATACKLRPLG
jgi:hypothetical protein